MKLISCNGDLIQVGYVMQNCDRAVGLAAAYISTRQFEIIEPNSGATRIHTDDKNLDQQGAAASPCRHRGDRSPFAVKGDYRSVAGGWRRNERHDLHGRHLAEMRP